MKISIVTPTYNEIENIEQIYSEIKKILENIGCDYEHLIIDNSSTDGTIDKIKNLAKQDKRLKVIINSKNFGHIRSPFYGLLQTTGDATILMASDFQDPPELIKDYIKLWKEGNKIVLAQKNKSKENIGIFYLRKIFYRFLNFISEDDLTKDTTGSGIFDKSVVSKLKEIRDPYPYFRGLISELSNDIKTIKFEQPKRQKGYTKNNIFTLYDIGILGIVKHSRKPMRLLIILGFLSSIISILIGIFYLIYKILFWNTFSVGLAPIIIGIFFISSIQITLLGLLGEYVGVILLHQRNMPLVIEKERINFD
tara:strand:- start:2052 stop:2978 length:927 start_codon:yes stop_codon:yes gene_type:complete